MTIENMMTVDVEDWYHICGVKEWIPPETWQALESRVEVNTSRILNIFRQKKIRATFFILGYIADRYPGLVEKIEKDGHEIATHGYAHNRVYTLTREQFREDLKKSLVALSRIVKSPVVGYRAPEWSIRDDSIWALDVLREEGFKWDSSMAPLPFIGRPEYPRIPHKMKLKAGVLMEIPPLVGSAGITTLPIGGGWGLRVLPYYYIRLAIEKMNRKNHPACIFLHPREFDSRVPKIKIPLVKRIVTGARIVSTQKRLCRLLNDFSFNTVSSVISRQ